MAAPRFLHVLVLFTGAGLLAACGNGTASAAAAPPAAGESGQVTQVGGAQLTITTPNGSATINFSKSTPVLRLTGATAADATTGACITALATKNPTGSLVARSVLISSPQAGKCTAQTNISGPAVGFGAGGRRSPSAPAFTSVSGKVTAAGESALELQTSKGGTAAVNFVSGTRFMRVVTASTSDLAAGECVAASGQKQGATLKASRIEILQQGRGGQAGCFFGGGGGGGQRRPAPSPTPQV